MKNEIKENKIKRNGGKIPFEMRGGRIQRTRHGGDETGKKTKEGSKEEKKQRCF